MKRTIPILIFIALAAIPAHAAGTWQKKVDEAQKTAKDKNQLIFVDLFAQWCTWCHRFEREIVPSEAFQNATKDMVLLRVNTEDRGEGTALSKRYNVRKLPTFLILTPDMTIAGVLEGYSPSDQFVARLESEIARYEEFRRQAATSEGLPAKDRLRIAREMVGRQEFPEAQKRLTALAAESSLPAAMRQEALYLTAMAQSNGGKNDEALETVAELLAGDAVQEWAEKATLLRAEVLLAQQNFAAALAEYRRFKSRYPKSPHLQVVNYYIPRLESVVARNGSK